MSFLIDYVLEGTDRPMGCPEGTTVKRNGEEDLAENVVAGDSVCLFAGFTKKATQVGRTEVNEDGTREPRTVLSGDA
jgi:hypothetical protein